jgi:hypothetical protein
LPLLALPPPRALLLLGRLHAPAPRYCVLDVHY